jgi:uncharacterized protein YxeA
MKRYFVLTLLTIIITLALNDSIYSQYWGTGSNSNTTYVRPYVKSNGTYVEGHYRTKRNSYNLDNFSAKGNYNPYTGKTGTKVYDSSYNSLNNNSYLNDNDHFNSKQNSKSNNYFNSNDLLNSNSIFDDDGIWDLGD